MHSGALSYNGDRSEGIKMDSEFSRVVDALPGLVWTAPAVIGDVHVMRKVG